MLLLIAATSLASAATFNVTKTNDTNDGVCDITDCSLREAVIAANTVPGADIISVPAGVYTLSIGPSGEDSAAGGDLDFLEDATVQGAGARTTIIDGGGIDRIFQTRTATVTFTINDVTLRNGDAQGSQGGAVYIQNGAGILNDVTLTGNTASDGGAIRVDAGAASLTAQRITISGNTANRAAAVGGDGGSVRVYITNSTISGNIAATEGGAFRIDHLELLNSTVVGNSAPAGKGGGATKVGGQVYQAINSIVANNTGGDCEDPFTSGSNSIDSDGSCGLAITADPALGSLQNNGGPTDTHALLAGSPAVEAGTNTGCPATDQRGVTRPDGFVCDIGAFEGDVHLLSGTVFEDADFAGTASEYDGGASDLPLPNVDVEIYNSSDVYIGSTTTNASGGFSFAVLDGTYKVRARTATIGDSNTPPAGTFNAACGITDPASGTGCVVPEQTWGNGAALIGGQSATADDTSTSNNAGPGDTWATATVSGVDLGGVNLGFAYNVIVKTAPTGQGSLGQFILNSNAIGSAAGTTANSSEFTIPATDPGFAAGVAVITVTAALPPVTDAATTIDATTQTTNRGNTNSVTLGTGGIVGVDAETLPQVAGPEVEIRDGATVANGLLLQADNAIVRGLAIVGFGAANGEAGIRIDSGASGVLIEKNVIGTSATSFTDPGAGVSGFSGIESVGGINGTIQNNLVGYAIRCIFMNTASSGWTIDRNEVRDCDLTTADGDGIAITDSSGITILRNRITGTSSQGFVITNSSNVSFTNNTLMGNGVGTTGSVTQSGAITMRSTASNVSIVRNILHANYGAGLLVNSGATQIRASENSFADNGTIGARSTATITGQIGIDLNAAGDDVNFGTAPYVTLNDIGDADAGANTLQNYAIIETALIDGPNLVLTGWSPAGATIEFFIANPDPAPAKFGEGETYLTTQIEGVSDTDGTTSSYSAPINGVNQGADNNVPRFSFNVPLTSLASPLSDGDKLTATATIIVSTGPTVGYTSE
ncbi:MAG: choice-of-anchor Q domain-containing protein, partial [Woeseia sp.]